MAAVAFLCILVPTVVAAVRIGQVLGEVSSADLALGCVAVASVTVTALLLSPIALNRQLHRA